MYDFFYWNKETKSSNEHANGKANKMTCQHTNKKEQGHKIEKNKPFYRKKIHLKKSTKKEKNTILKDDSLERTKNKKQNKNKIIDICIHLKLNKIIKKL